MLGLFQCLRAAAHTLGAAGPTLHTLNCILLFKGCGTQQSVIALGGDQYTNLVCYLSIITKSWVDFH